MTADGFVFDPYSPGFDADPAPSYRRLLSDAPVYWWARGHAFLVSRHADVTALVKDDRFSRSPKYGRGYQPLPDGPEYADYRDSADNSLFVVGPADHLRQRRLINAAFSPKAIEALREDTRQITRDALAGLPDDDVVNLASIATHIPTRVISRMLAIPKDLEADFLKFAAARIQLLTPMLPPAVRDAAMRATAVGYTQLRGLIAERRARPGTDLLSTLIHIEEEGTRLHEAELLGLCGAIVIAGSDTTVHAMRFLLLDLLRRPEILARVRADRALLRPALEESLRFNNFARLGSPVWACEDTEIRGVAVEKGQMVIGMLGAVGHDPEVFVRVETFDIDRPDLALARNFGSGPHVCLGVHLARVEIEAAVGEVLDRFPRMELVDGPTFAPNPMFRVIDRMMVRVR